FFGQAANCLGAQRLGDVVARLAGVGVAIARRKGEPLVGLLEILLDAETTGIEHAKVELAVGHATCGSLGEPLCSSLEFLVAQNATGIERGKVVHSHAIAGLGSALVPELGDLD